MPARASAVRRSRRTSAPNVEAGRPAECPIVGIGASAGGLEAFEALFRHLPKESGAAFVLVPHLDPEHASLLTEILQRVTAMPVVEVQDRMIARPNQVHVIPPNREMTLVRGSLSLTAPEMPRGQRMPIDHFLRSLAEEQGEKAIGVLLSGSGTDGTLGLRAIHGAGGVSFVQDPATAKYDGMPVSAIQSGVATYVLSPEKIPAKLLTCLATPRAGMALLSPGALAAGNVAAARSRVLALLRAGTGHDFSSYKASTINRRLERRMNVHAIEDLDAYARYLKENTGEARLLFREFLIGVTSFFRDPEAFAALEQIVLPRLLEGRESGQTLRVWVAGCATGEEAYSIAILLAEAMGKIHREFKVQIYATDLDEESIAVARSGTYPPNIAQDLTPERLRRYFMKEGTEYRVKREIREMIVFATQNVIKDPPFTRMDLVSCRNLLIYLEPDLQRKILGAFHYALNAGGALFLSPSESIGPHTDLFSPLDRKWKLFGTTISAAAGRAAAPRDPPWSHFPGPRPREEMPGAANETDLAELTKRLLLQSFCPAAVITDEDGTVLYVHGDTGKYLRPAPGRASLSLVEMTRGSLQAELRRALRSAMARTARTSRGKPDAEPNRVDGIKFAVRRIPGADGRPGRILVTFEDVKPAAASGRGRKTKAPPRRGAAGRIAELELEVEHLSASMKATLEDGQASGEELKSANEELQSTNEELQSTNEEMETSKEELQSVNEELATTNSELQSKIEELVSIQSDMKNFLDNTNVATIFLDEQLAIRRFNRDIRKVFHIVPSDVGRPLADIRSELKEIDVVTEARTVLDMLTPVELEAETTVGEGYMVRMTPYRTLDNVIDGVVITFTDITKRKAAESALRESTEFALNVVETLREPLLVLDGELRLVSASRSFFRTFQTSPEKALGQRLYEMGERQWDQPRLRELLERILPQNSSFEDFEIEDEFPGVGRRRYLLNARRLSGTSGRTKLILLSMEDMTGRRPPA